MHQQNGRQYATSMRRNRLKQVLQVKLLGLAFVRKKVAMKSCQDIKHHDVKSIVGSVNERAVRCVLKTLAQLYAMLIIFRMLGSVRKRVAIKSCQQDKTFDVQSIKIYVVYEKYSESQLRFMRYTCTHHRAAHAPLAKRKTSSKGTKERRL
jgi:hypothetical protein